MNEAFEFVAAEPEDHADFARFFGELRMSDPVPAPERWRAQMCADTRFLVESGRRVGYAWVQRYGPRGYVRHVVVAAQARGRGVGTALMRAIAGDLRSSGCTRWELNVKRDNAPAIKLYERCGMSFRHEAHVVRLPWSLLESLPWPALDARRVELADEGAIESAFDLPGGQIRTLARNERRAQVAVREDGVFTGFASFDPDFPGCAPFRARDPRVAAALLRAAHSHRRPEDERVQVFLEDSTAAAGALIERGAELVFEVLHFEGAIPSDAALRSTR